MPRVVGYIQGDGVITNGSILTNPSDQTVLADTGALNAGNYLLAVTGALSVALVYDLQIRDAANATNVYSVRRRPAAGNEDFLVGFKVPIGQGQRVRCLLQGGITGEVQLTIINGEVG